MIKIPTPLTVAVKVLVSHGGMGPLVNGKVCAETGRDRHSSSRSRRLEGKIRNMEGVGWIPVRNERSYSYQFQYY